MNRINDENALKLLNVEFPELYFLNLFFNNLKTFEIFENIHKLKKLRKLYIGLNRFKKKQNEDEKINYDCKSIEKIGLSRGVLSNETIDLIERFKFENLKKLYLSACGLNSLSFIDKLNCKSEKLEGIWLNLNNISEFFPLVKFKELKTIKLNKNLITDIRKLVDFVKNFEHLEIIDFSDNNIDTNDKNNNEILHKIKELKDKLKIII